MEFFLFIVANLIFFFLAYKVTKGKKKVALVLMFFLIGCIVIRIVLNFRPDWESLVFPSINYIKYQGFWFYLIASVFFGTTVSYLHIKWNKVVLAATWVLVIMYGLHSNLWLITMKTYGKQIFPNIDNHHLYQSTIYTCAPASCAIAASYFDIRLSEQEMARRCLTTENYGTNLFNIYRGLKLTLPKDKYDIQIKKLTVEELVIKNQVSVTLWEEIMHVICVVGMGDSVWVHDPLKRVPETWEKSKLEDRYNGFAVIIKPF